jgi:integrase/recombinase XerD
MKTLSTHLQQYLQLRRRLGFKLRDAGGILSKFVLFAKRQRAAFVTTKLALRWAIQPVDCHPALWTTRLNKVRQFAQYVSALDPRTEIPPHGLLPHRYHRKSPYLYSDQEVHDLISAARRLPSPQHLRGATYTTLFGLLAVTGMRVGEALGLDRADVDLAQALLTVRQTKGNQPRLVPIHPSTVQVLRRYERLRDRVCPQPISRHFFLSERGAPLTYCIVRYWFIKVSRQIGLRQPSDRHGPRIHDLRHRFSIRTLVHWYRTDQDVEAHLPELATYLGHRHVNDTYWYLSATPELLQLATRRWKRQEGGCRS